MKTLSLIGLLSTVAYAGDANAPLYKSECKGWVARVTQALLNADRAEPLVIPDPPRPFCDKYVMDTSDGRNAWLMYQDQVARQKAEQEAKGEPTPDPRMKTFTFTKVTPPRTERFTEAEACEWVQHLTTECGPSCEVKGGYDRHCLRTCVHAKQGTGFNFVATCKRLAAWMY